MSKEDIMTAQEICGILDIKLNTLYDNRYRERMSIPVYKMGKRLFAYKREFDKWYRNISLGVVV